MANPSSRRRKLWAVCKAAIWGAVVFDAIILIFGLLANATYGVVNTFV